MPVFVHAEKIAPEVFFKDPAYNTFSVSPDGRYLATIADYMGFKNIYLYNLEDDTIAALTNERKDISSLFWANNHRIIYTLTNDKDDAVDVSGGLLAIDVDGNNLTVLQQPYSSQAKNGVALKGESVHILSRLHNDEEYVLVSSNKRRLYYPDVYKLNVNNGDKVKVFYNPGNISSYLADPAGEIRFGTEYDDLDQKHETTWFRKDDGEWVKLWEYFDDITNATPIAIDHEKNVAYIQSNVGRDKYAIFKYDMATMEMDPNPVIEDPVYDVIPTTIIRTIGRDGIAGFAYEADKPRNVYLYKNYRQLQEAIDEVMPDTYNCIYSKSYDGKQMVIMSYSDVQAAIYNRLNLDTMELTFLSADRPWLKPQDLCKTTPVSWTARDGKTIYGYLTLPKTWKEGHPVPMIVRPHGGPWAREEWGLTWYFPLERQFYANRGFAVLEPNFRGSTGYGKEYLTSSFKHIAQMNYDFVDGTQWAIDQGYALPGKIGIEGASWGGYATMIGVTKFPEYFNFGINFMGVVDLPAHINRYLVRDKYSKNKTAAYDYWCERIGDPTIPEDRKNLDEWSAINYVGNIDGPVFVYHGLVDQNVHIEQARALVSALKSEDKEFEEVIRVDEAHSTHFENDRIDTYTKIDEFLRKILTKK